MNNNIVNFKEEFSSKSRCSILYFALAHKIISLSQHGKNSVFFHVLLQLLLTGKRRVKVNTSEQIETNE